MSHRDRALDHIAAVQTEAEAVGQGLAPETVLEVGAALAQAEAILYVGDQLRALAEARPVRVEMTDAILDPHKIAQSLAEHRRRGGQS